MCLWALSLVYVVVGVFFFKQKTAYEMRISDWSSDVCSSDLLPLGTQLQGAAALGREHRGGGRELIQVRGRIERIAPGEVVMLEVGRLVRNAGDRKSVV